MTLKEIFEKALLDGQCQMCKNTLDNMTGRKTYICKECRKKLGIKDYNEYMRWLTQYIIRKNRKTIGGKGCVMKFRNSKKCKRTIVLKGTIEPKTFIS